MKSSIYSSLNSPQQYLLDKGQLTTENPTTLKQLKGLYAFLQKQKSTHLMPPKSQCLTPLRVLKVPGSYSQDFSSCLRLGLPKYTLEKDLEKLGERVLEQGYNGLCFYPDSTQKSAWIDLPLDKVIAPLKNMGLHIQLEVGHTQLCSHFFSTLPKRLQSLHKLCQEEIEWIWPACFPLFHAFTPEENRNLSLLEKMEKELQCLSQYLPRFHYFLPSDPGPYSLFSWYNPSECQGMLMDLLALLPPRVHLHFSSQSDFAHALYPQLLKENNWQHLPLAPIFPLFVSPHGKGLWPEIPLHRIYPFFETLQHLPHPQVHIQSPDLPFSSNLFSFYLYFIALKFWFPLPFKTLYEEWLNENAPLSSLPSECLEEFSLLAESLRDISLSQDPKTLGESLLSRTQLLEARCPQDHLDLLSSQIKYGLRDMRKLILYYLQKRKLNIPQALKGEDLKESFFAYLPSSNSQGIPRSMQVHLYNNPEEITFDERMKTLYNEMRVLNYV